MVPWSQANTRKNGRDEMSQGEYENVGPEQDEAATPHEQDPLDTLLDQALAPAEPPAGLEQRIVAASVEASRASAPTRHAPAPTSGREHEAAPAPLSLGDASPRGAWSSGVGALAAAAVLALAIFGAWAVLEPGATTPSGTGSQQAGTSELDRLAALEQELGALEHAAGGTDFDPINEQIELLALQLELTRAEASWTSDEPLEAVAGDVQTYQLLHDWELDLAWAY